MQFFQPAVLCSINIFTMLFSSAARNDLIRFRINPTKIFPFGARLVLFLVPVGNAFISVSNASFLIGLINKEKEKKLHS